VGNGSTSGAGARESIEDSGSDSSSVTLQAEDEPTSDVERQADEAVQALRRQNEHAPGTLKWYWQRLREAPVAALADRMPNLAQILYSLVEAKVRYRVTDNGFIALLVLIVCIILRPLGYDGMENRVPHEEVSCPTTKYMVYRLLGVRPANRFEWHMCPNGCHVWRPLKAFQWNRVKHDRCPVCGHHRFKHVRRTIRGVATQQPTRKPARRFWCIGIRRAIQ
jgi:hypothetical protein